MPKVSKEQTYVLTAEERAGPIFVSKPDLMGVKWWAKEQGITITAALHEMIVEFLRPRLAIAQQGLLLEAEKQGILDPDRRKKLFRRRR